MTDSKRALLAIVGLGVVLRVVASLAIGADAPLNEFGIIGRNLAEGRHFSFYSEQADGRVVVDADHAGRPLPSAFMPPGYTVTVAAAQGLSSDDRGAVRVLQAFNLLFAIAAMLLIHQLGRELFGPRAGLLAALAYAVYPVLVYLSTQASAADMYIPLDLAALWLLIRARRGGEVRPAVLAGLTLGALCLFRSEALVLVPIAAVWLALGFGGPRHGRAVVAALLVPAAVLPGAWMIRNAAALDSVTPSMTTTGGFNLWVGNHAGASGSQKRFRAEDAALQAELDRLPAGPSYETRRDKVYMRAALDHVRAHPWSTVVLDAKKLVMTLTADVYDHRSRNLLYVGSWAVLLVLAGYGIARRPLPRPERWLFGGYLLFALAVPTVFFTLARYKLALELPLLVFAAAGVDAAIDRRRSR